MAEDALLSRLGSVLDRFGRVPSPVEAQMQEAQPEPPVPPETPEAVPQGALDKMGGSEMPQRSIDTLDAARAALENYRNRRGV
tara:strand:- start:12627 stop:12875 length:249 start_codon:yes stop_codon:yes gene_type:complete